MAVEESGTSITREPGFFASLRAVITDFAALLHTRVELASTEVEEELERLKQMLLLGAISLFCAGAGVILFTFFIVVIFWDTHRVLALGGFAALYLVLGLATGLVLRRRMAARPRPFSATISELAKDRERMEFRS